MRILILAILFACALSFNINATNDGIVPIVLFHGYGASCDQPLAQYLSQRLSIYAICIEPSPNPEEGPEYSINTPIKAQGQRACEMINNSTIFQGEFDLIGFSQGTIMSRYIIQNCNLTGTVRNFISFGGPLNGQYPPSCSWYDVYCIAKNFMDSQKVYTDEIQSTWAPASYWRDPAHYQNYIQHSSWLAEANNEINFSEDRRQRMLDLNRALFIKWDDEEVISPPESSWWGGYDENFNVIDRFHSDVYTNDLIGIKTLEEENRAIFVNIPGVHMQYTFEQIDEIVIPFILNQ